jgi:DNA-binding CsgD family transcriptional regulator/tetratricopeptide (TPR) repeat protein
VALDRDLGGEETRWVAESVVVPSADGLIGRAAELDLALGELDRLGRGPSSVLVVEGEAGIGKTRLVQSLVGEARSRDLRVLSGGGHPFERTRPFGLAASALGLSARSTDPRAAAIGRLLAGRGGEPSATPGDIQWRVVEEIVDLVETLCAERPVLLVTEDVHWADTASLLAVLSLTRQLSLAPLLTVVTTRSSPLPGSVVRLLDDLAAGGGRSLCLAPLSADEVTALATHELGARPGPRLTALLAKAGGNPLWATAMLRSLAADGGLSRSATEVDATVSELPASLGDLVDRRLRDLPGPTLELLRIAAVLGDAVSLRDVAAVARRSPAEAARQLGEAYDAQLLDRVDERVVFRHQLVHDAIYQQVPAPARRVLHREAAVTLMAAGDDPLAVADHLVRGSERGDEEAATWLRQAARGAAGQAPPVTLELVRRAEALLPGGHRDADAVSAEVVQALLRAGDVAEASARAEAVLGRPHVAEVDIPLRVALVSALALQNRADELVAVVEDSLASPERVGPAEQVVMLAQQSWALTYSGAPAEGEAVAARALAVAEATQDPALSVWALTALQVAEGRQGRFDAALSHARRAAAFAEGSAGPRALPLQPRLMLGMALFDCDLVGEARTAFRAALDDELGSAWWLSATLMADAQASYALGDWDDAVPGLMAGEQAAREKANPLLEWQSLAYRTVIATGRGELGVARELADRFAGTLQGEELPYNAGILAFAAAALEAAEGNSHGAFDVLLRCWRVDAARESRFYHRCLAPDLVRLALALGRREVAGEVADAVEAGADLAREVPTVRSLALRCRGLVDDDAASLVAAAALARRSPLLVEHAGACEDAASALAKDGRREEAATLLGEALARYEAAGADAWAGRVRAGLRSVGAHPGVKGSRHRPETGWESLTSTERTVSVLVAEGLTNGAVARRMYVSPHTVNTHLRHVYAKLGVSNRVGLAAVVHRSIE